LKNLTIRWAVLSIVFTSIVFGISRCTKISEEKVWVLIDSIQRNHKLSPKELNEYIIKTPELLNQRIKRDVDSAIYEYEKEEARSYRPTMKNQQILDEYRYRPELVLIENAVYYEFKPDNSEAQRELGGVMGIRASFVSPHPEEISQ
jgi:hypothetical protein